MSVNKSYVLPIKNITDEDLQKKFNEQFYYEGKQCEFCEGYQKLNSDYGVCFKKDCIFKNRVVFEHFACNKFKFKKQSKDFQDCKLNKCIEMFKDKGIQLENEKIYNIYENENNYIIDYEGSITIKKQINELSRCLCCNKILDECTCKTHRDK